MRALKTSDIFSFARVIRESNIREELMMLLQKIANQDEVNTERVGINAILIIVEAMSDKKAEKAIYEALAPVFEKTVDEMKDMPPAELMESLKRLSEENDLKNFFSFVFGTAGKN